MRVWVARAQPGADATAERLRAMGHEPVVAPVLEVRRLAGANLDLAGVQALAFTSANGVRAFAQMEARRDLPVFTVGAATAEVAREAGFAQVESAEGDVATLSALLAERRPGLVLHAGAKETAGDLAPGGVEVRSAAIYETVALTPALELSTLDAVLVHSPKAARVVAAMAAGFPIRALALAPACAAPLVGAGITVATSPLPNETALLTLLGT